MNNENASYFWIWQKRKEWREAVFDAFDKETDRGVAIISICYLDRLLEELIKASYIKDNKISKLFEEEQLLRSFYSKLNIAYFGGLIPKEIFNDLIIINKIRNIFAHEITANIDFSDKVVSNKINNFCQLPDKLRAFPPKLKFTLIVIHVGSFLRFSRFALKQQHIRSVVETLGLNKVDFQNMLLTPAEIHKLVKS